MRAAVALTMLCATAAVAADPGVFPDSARKVAEHRYKAAGDFDEVMKWYKKALPSSAYPRKQIVNQPGIKALHIVNPSGRGWEGLNIYENNDEVRIYVVVAPDSGKKKKTK